jgi:hypothetical protein
MHNVPTGSVVPKGGYGAIQDVVRFRVLETGRLETQIKPACTGEKPKGGVACRLFVWKK